MKSFKQSIDEGYRNYDDNRTGFAKRKREDDEYHTPDPTTRTHKIGFHVSKDGGEKHHRTVTISNSTKSHDEAKATAREHLKKQGYKIHEEAELSEDQTASEFKVKKFVGQDGKTHTRKIRPHTVHFKNSKSNAEPEEDKNSDDKEDMKKEQLELASFTSFVEASDTVQKDKNGKVVSWKHEGDWKKTDPKKDPEGKIHNLTGQALKKTKELTKEEAELDEKFINGREYASHGLMHPDHAKMAIHQKTGHNVDFYAHGSGDKISGKVTKNDGKEVHFQADKNSGGKAHKFKVTPHLPSQHNEEVELDESLDPSEIASNPRMYSADDAKKAYYHKKATASDKQSLERHLDRHHGNKEWRRPVKEETQVEEQAPVAPTIDRKYIKGTPEWKAHKEKNKPINGHPTNNVKEEAEQVDEVAPPGFEGTVKAMKKHKDEIDNPYALAWYMKNKGDKSHRKADGSVKKEDVMKSYKQFVESLQAATASEIEEETVDENAFDWKSGGHKTSNRYDVKQVGNRTIVTRKYDPETGHSTGTDEPASTEKRGRGRPAGSKSGAKQKGSSKSNDYRGVATHSLNLPNTK